MVQSKDVDGSPMTFSRARKFEKMETSSDFSMFRQTGFLNLSRLWHWVPYNHLEKFQSVMGFKNSPEVEEAHLLSNCTLVPRKEGKWRVTMTV